MAGKKKKAFVKPEPKPEPKPEAVVSRPVGELVRKALEDTVPPEPEFDTKGRIRNVEQNLEEFVALVGDQLGEPFKTKAANIILKRKRA